jgi:collagenase-like PrtC family protease
MRRITDNGRFLVEANDMGAVNMLNTRWPFVVGPHVNVYNAAALRLLAEFGARRWVAPVELDRDALRAMQRQRPHGLETEVFAFGRLPLAFSARCFTARAHNVSKDECDLRCAEYPDGMPLLTQEGEPFLVLNGIQVQSGRTHSLIGEIAELRDLDIDVVRVSPQSRGTFEIIDVFRGSDRITEHVFEMRLPIVLQRVEQILNVQAGLGIALDAEPTVEKQRVRIFTSGSEQPEILQAPADGYVGMHG